LTFVQTGQNLFWWWECFGEGNVSETCGLNVFQDDFPDCNVLVLLTTKFGYSPCGHIRQSTNKEIFFSSNQDDLGFKPFNVVSEDMHGCAGISPLQTPTQNGPFLVTHMSRNKCKQKINNVAVYFGSKYACHGYHISVPQQRVQCIAAGPHAPVCSFLSALPQLTVCPVTSRRQFFNR
jgi:hypothetical protein